MNPAGENHPEAAPYHFQGDLQGPDGHTHHRLRRCGCAALQGRPGTGKLTVASLRCCLFTLVRVSPPHAVSSLACCLCSAGTTTAQKLPHATCGTTGVTATWLGPKACFFCFSLFLCRRCTQAGKVHRLTAAVSRSASQCHPHCTATPEVMITRAKPMRAAVEALFSHTWDYAQEVLGWTVDNLDLVVPHQVRMRY